MNQKFFKKKYKSQSNTVRPVVTAHLSPSLFFASLPKHRMYVLYQLASIWILPVFPRLKKKLKKGDPSELTFSGGQKVEPFFSPFLLFFDPPPVYEFL